jgi:hypothetical protein
MRLDQTQALVAEINNCSDVSSFKTVTGRNGGTYVCKELVYAYAMWISPKFHLQVIRAYDARFNDITPARTASAMGVGDSRSILAAV